MKAMKTLLIGLLVILVINSYRIIAIPPIAAEFYGTAKSDTVNVSVGTNISAYDPNGTLCGYFIVSANGYYGSLSCKGDDTETAVDEGAVSGDNITFYIDGNTTSMVGNITWIEGRYSNLNITAFINHAPTFDHSLKNQTVSDNHQLLYDINCSDQDGDTLTYYDDTSLFNISSSTGLIDWTPSQNQVGVYSINVTCSDGQVNTSGTFLITVNDVNNAPVLGSIGNQIVTEGELFTFDVNATDPDNDTLTYSANTTIFIINNSTGIINFTPTIAQVGNYSINISVNDSLLVDYEIVSFRIVRGPYCGDGSCGSTEDCSSCSSDCGSCPAAPGAEAGAGEEAAAAAARRIIRICQEKWECSDWSSCSIDGLQTRKCIDVNKCGTQKKKPSEIQTCAYTPTCFDGTQNGGETGVDCGGPCPPCSIPVSCSDGIQNQGEEDIDCGGPCPPCEIIKYAKIPIPQLAPLVKKVPWLLLLIVSVLVSSIILGDNVYVKRITKKEFEEYRKKISKYKRMRKRVYIASAILSLVGLTFTFYVYLVSDKPEMIKELIWVPIAFIVIILSSTFFVARHFKYYEYKKRRKEEQFFLEHKKRKKNLIKMEDELLISLELKIINKIDSLVKQNAFKEEEVLNKIKDVFSILKDLVEKRNEKTKPIGINEEIKAQVPNLSNNLNLIDLSKDYPEFKESLTALQRLKEEDEGIEKKGRKKKEEGKIEKIERFLLSIAVVSQDKHLISVIKSSEALINIYNQLVDVYESYKEQLDNKEIIEEDLIKKEFLFSKKIEEITNGPIVIETIKANVKYASLYNSLVDLYNHYKRRQELRNELKNMEKCYDE